MSTLSNNKVEWNKYTKILKNNNKIILAQTQTGLWVRIEERFYELLNELIEIKELDKIKGEIESINVAQNEKIYIKELIKKLWEINILTSSNEENYELEEVTFAITNSCNLNCKHCAASANEVFRGTLNLRDIYKIFDYFIAMNLKIVVITGGEPLIRKDFPEIISYLRKNFKGKIVIMTNGTLISKKMAKFLSENVDAFDISLDGYDEKSVAFIRGEGTYQKVIDGIKYLKSFGVEEIRVSMVNTRQNVHHNKEFKELCQDLGVKPVFRGFDRVGRGEKNYDIFNIERDLDFTLSRENEKELRNLKKQINAKNYCKAGKNGFYVDEIGDIYPCSVLIYPAFKIGNVLEMEDDFRKIKNYKDVMKKLETCVVDNVDKCKDCNVRYFCTKGCPGLDYHLFTNEEFRKERCEQMREYYQKLAWEV